MAEKFLKPVWAILNNAIKKLQNEDATLNSEQIYSKAYEVVMNKHGFCLYNGLRELLTEQMQQQVRPEVLESILQDNLLVKLKAVWTSHHAAMLMINDMLGYVDRFYAKQRGLDTIYNLGLRIFRDEIVCCPEIKQALQNKLLDMIKTERLGGTINQTYIKDVCSMLITLGLNSRYTYEQIFELPFLADSSAFYKIESENLVRNFPKDYIAKMKSRMSEELTRAALYLDKDTAEHIQRVLEQIIETDKPV